MQDYDVIYFIQGLPVNLEDVYTSKNGIFNYKNFTKDLTMS